MQPNPNWVLSKVSVTLRNGAVVEGDSAQVFEKPDGEPVALQVTAPDGKVSIPWINIVSIAHA